MRGLCDSDVRARVTMYLQGYAARGEFLLYVPFLCNATLLILATQIPLRGMRTSLRFASGVRSHRKSKRKNTTQGGVFDLRDSTLARTTRSVIRRENSSTGRVFYTAPTSNPRRRNKRKNTTRGGVFPFMVHLNR